MDFRKYLQKFTDNMEMMTGHKPTTAEMIRHAVCGTADHFIYGSTITDYFELTFWQKSRKEKSRYMTWKYHKKFIYEVDSIETILKLSDKKEMYRSLRKFVDRRQLDSDRCSKKEFHDFIHQVPEFLYKPNDASCGKGIQLFNSNAYSEEKLFEILRNMPAGTLDERIIQHSEISSVYPGSVNTIRLFTFRTDDTVYYTGAVLRTGTNSYIDNYSAGGIVFSVDVSTGLISEPGENLIGERFVCHPTTGKKMQGFRIPNWEMLLDYVYGLASEFELNYAAWDLAVTENRIELVEANPAGMINVIQVAGGSGKKEIYQMLEREWKKKPYTRHGQILKRIYC